VILSNGFIYENKIGVDDGDGGYFPKPFILTGQDYRNVRDMCGISPDLILRQLPDWTPSDRMEETDGGQSFKSYRWHYNYMTKITGLRADQWGLPSSLYGIRHNAIIRSNSAQTNITEDITTVEDSIAANADARRDLRAEKGERKQAVNEFKRLAAALESMTALLATASKRLRANNLEEVTAKAAPISDAESPTGGTGGAGGGSATTSPARAPESTPHPVSQSPAEEG
jgi:hypothetical protein